MMVEAAEMTKPKEGRFSSEDVEALTLVLIPMVVERGLPYTHKLYMAVFETIIEATEKTVET